MAEPEGAMPPLPSMDDFQRKHPECPYFQSNRQGLCLDYCRRGPVACFLCGYKLGLDHGYEDGYADGRNDPEWEPSDDEDCI